MVESPISDILQREIEVLESKLSTLCKMRDLAKGLEFEESSGVSVLPGEFVGFKIAAAVERYLRKLNPPRAAHLETEVYPALLKGGCKLGPERDSAGNDRRPRNLKTTMTTNSKNNDDLFFFSQESLMVRLRHAAPAPSGTSGMLQ